jgi:rod shape determining protein RodA
LDRYGLKFPALLRFAAMFDRRLLANFDWVLFLNALVISLMGVAAIYSASKGYTTSTQYWLRQIYWIGVAMAAGFIVLLVDMRAIGRWAYLFHGIVIILLALVLRHGVGGAGSQVERWFMVGGVALQPSEFAKFSTVLAVAFYFRDNRRVGNLGLRDLLVPLGLIGVPFILIVQQPDLGTAMLLALIAIPLMILAGVRLKLLGILVVLGVLAAGVLVTSFKFGYYRFDDDVIKTLQSEDVPPVLVEQARALKGQRYWTASSLRAKFTQRVQVAAGDPFLETVEESAFKPFISYVLRPYQQKRLITFVNPDADPLGAGYHVIQSKVAIGSGKFLGKGFGQSTQGSLNFLPARHTDFIFAIFAEEWGFVGAFILIGLYLALTLRGLSIILQTRDRFSAFLTLGIVSIIGLQVIVNVGMAAGLLPVVGVPLPFFSYGGSSMISMTIGVAMLLNIRMRRFLWG